MVKEETKSHINWPISSPCQYPPSTNAWTIICLYHSSKIWMQTGHIYMCVCLCSPALHQGKEAPFELHAILQWCCTALTYKCQTTIRNFFKHCSNVSHLIGICVYFRLWSDVFPSISYFLSGFHLMGLLPNFTWCFRSPWHCSEARSSVNEQDTTTILIVNYSLLVIHSCYLLVTVLLPSEWFTTILFTCSGCSVPCFALSLTYFYSLHISNNGATIPYLVILHQ